MLLGLEGERVDVDGVDGSQHHRFRVGTRSRDQVARRVESTARVVLERLDLPEIVPIAFVEAILAVELDAAAVHNVVVGKGLRIRGRCTCVEVNRATCRQRAVEAARILEDPDQLLDRVVQREVQAGLRGRHGLRQGVLELLNQVLVRVLREPATLIRVQVDVVNVDGRILRRGQSGSGSRDGRPLTLLDKVSCFAERNVEVDVVVLESNERQGQTRVAVEPEPERDVEHRRTTIACRQRARGTDRTRQQLVSLHTLVIAGRQALPQVPPLTVVTVNDLSTDFHLNLIQQEVSEAAHAASRPQHVVCRACCRRGGVGQGHLKVGAVDKVSVAIHDGHHALAVLSRACEVDTHRLHGEVGVPLVHDLPEGDVGVARDVCVLCTVGNELEKTATHCVYLLRGYILLRLNNDARRGVPNFGCRYMRVCPRGRMCKTTKAAPPRG